MEFRGESKMFKSLLVFAFFSLSTLVYGSPFQGADITIYLDLFCEAGESSGNYVLPSSVSLSKKFGKTILVMTDEIDGEGFELRINQSFELEDSGENPGGVKSVFLNTQKKSDKSARKERGGYSRQREIQPPISEKILLGYIDLRRSCYNEGDHPDMAVSLLDSAAMEELGLVHGDIAEVSMTKERSSKCKKQGWASWDRFKRWASGDSEDIFYAEETLEVSFDLDADTYKPLVLTKTYPVAFSDKDCSELR